MNAALRFPRRKESVNNGRVIVKIHLADEISTIIKIT
jgi:hypothetical protein